MQKKNSVVEDTELGQQEKSGEAKTEELKLRTMEETEKQGSKLREVMKARKDERLAIREKQKEKKVEPKLPEKELVIYNAGVLGCKVKWGGGGELPKRLSGSWTSRALAQREINQYLISRGASLG